MTNGPGFLKKQPGPFYFTQHLIFVKQRNLFPRMITWAMKTNFFILFADVLSLLLKQKSI